MAHQATFWANAVRPKSGTLADNVRIDSIGRGILPHWALFRIRLITGKKLDRIAMQSFWIDSTISAWEFNK